jgi:hypothetical protein
MPSDYRRLAGMAPPVSDKADKEEKKAQAAAIATAARQLTELLLERGLYSPVDLTFPFSFGSDDLDDLRPKIMNMPCTNCTGVHTTSWKRDDNYSDSCIYRCVSCDQESIKYYMAFTCPQATMVSVNGRQIYMAKHFRVEKVGQVPGWVAPVPDLLKKALGTVGVDHYRKGASSLRAGRGIGAVAYFRRIVDDHLDDLLRVLEEAAVAQGDEAMAGRIRAANGSFQATERLKIASENTPAILRPGNVNPMGTLYELLSDGLHNKSDEECAIAAGKAQRALAFFFETWGAYGERSKDYATEMTKQATKTA